MAAKAVAQAESDNITLSAASGASDQGGKWLRAMELPAENTCGPEEQDITAYSAAVSACEKVAGEGAGSYHCVGCNSLFRCSPCHECDSRYCCDACGVCCFGSGCFSCFGSCCPSVAPVSTLGSSGRCGLPLSAHLGHGAGCSVQPMRALAAWRGTHHCASRSPLPARWRGLKGCPACYVALAADVVFATAATTTPSAAGHCSETVGPASVAAHFASVATAAARFVAPVCPPPLRAPLRGARPLRGFLWAGPPLSMACRCGIQWYEGAGPRAQQLAGVASAPGCPRGS